MTGHIGAMSIGWDPGLFSLARIYFGAVACGWEHLYLLG